MRTLLLLQMPDNPDQPQQQDEPDQENDEPDQPLQQQVGRHWQPLGFFSKKLSKTEVNYSTFDA